MDSFDQAVKKTIEYLETEMQGIRTGRANPMLIEHLPIECYGSISPLQQVASISAPEPQTLVVQPWDPSIIKDIERSISQSSLGINPVVDSRVIRLPFPPMTEERRKELTKVVREKGEEAKISIRNAREDMIKDLRQSERDGDLSEDALDNALKDLQTRVQSGNSSIDHLVKQKTEEVERI